MSKIQFLNYFCFNQNLFTRAYQIHAFIIQADEMPMLLTVTTRIFVHVTQYLFTLNASLSHVKNLSFELQMQLHNKELLQLVSCFCND